MNEWLLSSSDNGCISQTIAYRVDINNLLDQIHKSHWVSPVTMFRDNENLRFSMLLLLLLSAYVLFECLSDQSHHLNSSSLCAEHAHRSNGAAQVPPQEGAPRPREPTSARNALATTPRHSQGHAGT